MHKKSTLLTILGILILLLSNVMPLLAQGAQLEWVEQDADSSSEMFAITTDKDGNIYATGTFSGTVNFDPNSTSGILTATDSSDGYISKRNPQGDLVWIKHLTSTGNCYGTAITVDDSGMVYICGAGTGTIDLNPDTGIFYITNATEAYFFAKYDASGGFIWGTNTGRIGTRPWSGSKIGNPFDVSASGNIYFAGISNEDSLIFDPATGIAPVYAHYRVIMPGWEVPYPILYFGKLDSVGTLDWVNGFPTDATFADVANIVLDREEYLYATGYFGMSVDFDPGPDTTQLASNGGSDVFVLKMSKEGELVWAKNMGGAGNDRGTSITLDGCNNVYVAGDFLGFPADFDPGPNTYIITPENPTAVIPTADIFVTKLDYDGNFVWAKSMGGPNGEGVPYLCRDVSNNLYITGKAVGNTDYDPDTALVYNLPHQAANDWGMFIAKWDADGQFIWAGANIMDLSGGFAHPSPFRIQVSDSGKIYTFGIFRDTVDFDPGAGTEYLMANKPTGHFLLKLAEDNFTPPVYDTTVIAACDSFPLDQRTFTSSGIYKLNLISSAGCDSFIILDLTIHHIIPAIINVNNFTLSTGAPYETYQWCLEGIPVAGAVQNNYVITENGNYTVIVTDSNGCMDTSDVYQVNNFTGINPNDALTSQIRIYPNPANEEVFIESSPSLPIQRIGIVNMLGAEINSIPGNSHLRQTLNIRHLPPAVYVLRIQTDKGTTVRKLEIGQ